jgi:hypothetical protein
LKSIPDDNQDKDGQQSVKKRGHRLSGLLWQRRAARLAALAEDP